MFPGAHAVVYYNDAGEPLGWDYPSSDEGDSDPHDDYDSNYYDGGDDEEDEDEEE